MNAKKIQSRNYSFVALIVAGIAVLAAILLGITRGLVAMQVFTVAKVENLNRAILVSIGVIILGLAIYAFVEPDRVRRAFTGRQARYGSNALIMVLAFLGILIVANVLAFQNPVNVADLTQDKSNTLSPELSKAVKQLPAKVVATGFFAQSSTAEAAKLLGNIKANSNGNFDYKFINPDQDPQAAIAAGITGDGKILLQMGQHKTIAASATEDEILKGLLRLLNPQSSEIYFLTGHGERDITISTHSSPHKGASTPPSRSHERPPGFGRPFLWPKSDSRLLDLRRRPLQRSLREDLDQVAAKLG